MPQEECRQQRSFNAAGLSGLRPNYKSLGGVAFWEGGAYLGQGLSRYCLQQTVRARAREAARALEPEANKEFVDNGYQGVTYVGPRQACPDPDGLLG